MSKMSLPVTNGVNLPYASAYADDLIDCVIIRTEILHNVFFKKTVCFCRAFCMLENGTELLWF